MVQYLWILKAIRMACTFLPGGMPGAANLQAHEGLARLIRKHYDAGRPLAAICAAPMVYGQMGLLSGLRATCYPGFEDKLTGAEATGELVVCDGRFFLGKGPAAVLELAYTIVAHFCGQQKADEIRAAMLYLGIGCTTLTTLMNSYIMRHLEAVKASVTSCIGTVVTLVAGVLILKESLGVLQVLCCVLILLAVVGTNYFGKKN